MVIGKVIGTVVASRKEPELVGLRLLAVSPIDVRTGALKDGGVVAVDAVGAGVGEVVLYATGSSARQTKETQNRPVDATIMAIVDILEVGGTVLYKKD
ncbi:MAG: ethanolamine utilization protein EutN [Myxococcales bacterium]|nr:ethanolamine utilization protein EutN [Myxococcales bacterium]